ncbi:MAG: NAD-dependent epimerase/dehydratase family protein [Woeseiaceae bacterium]|nr:NAD-dependent epimerase/dehydratase family protein [Woeseiaceae bacterium]
MSPTKVFTLVTGVGYTGRRVLELLPAAAALGLSRSRVETDRHVQTVDLDGASTPLVKLPEAGAVIYTVPPKGEPPDQRLQRLLSLLSSPPGRFVYISTTGVYGDCGGRTVTEAALSNPCSERARRRVAAEDLLAGWADHHAADLVVLRAPGIYGPGRLGVERLKAGGPVLVEAHAGPGNRIHVDDLARCCVAALSPDVPAGIYNVGDNDHRSATWFSAEVARQLGLPAPPEISREAAKQQFSPQRWSFLRESRRVDTTKMRDVLGVTPRYASPEEGISASLR